MSMYTGKKVNAPWGLDFGGQDMMVSTTRSDEKSADEAARDAAKKKTEFDKKTSDKYDKTMADGTHTGAQQAFTDAMGAASQAAPSGLSALDLNNQKSQVAAQNQTGTRNALAGMSSMMGGPNSAAYAQTAGRLQAGGSAATAATMGNIDIAENQRMAQLEMQRRQQMLGGAGIGASLAGTQSSLAQGAAGQQLQAQNLNMQAQQQWVADQQRQQQLDQGYDLASYQANINGPRTIHWNGETEYTNPYKKMTGSVLPSVNPYL